MSTRTLWRPRVVARRTLSYCLALAGFGALSTSGCLNRPLEPSDARTTSTNALPLAQSAVDKIDLLLMIDNSGSMADKQLILQAAVPQLVASLVNPSCIDDSGKVVSTPAGPKAPCPAGTTREFQPVLDIHVGIIDSSLGSRGGTAYCINSASDPNEDDQGHLISRAPSGSVATYADEGFLAWDPNGALVPPGDNDLGDPSSGFIGKLSEMVQGVGENGCGFESQLESWYRFLVDPNPPQSFSIQNNVGTPGQLDSILTKQRADFLRPDSLLAILMLSDENDCSLREDYGYAVMSASMPAPRAVCKDNPNDACCFSCGQDEGTCPHDPTCFDAQGHVTTASDDPIDLRCYNQKQRFGIDLLFSTQRYVDGLTKAAIADRNGNIVPNPIYADLNPGDKDVTIRDPSLVFLAGIVGVPWQDIARQDADGTPDLLSGLDSKQQAVGGLKSADELAKKDANGTSTWDIILGDPASGKAPLDPLMIESQTPRSGTNPITGDRIAPPGSAADANAINGHEYTTLVNPLGDLEYACIFDLPTPSPVCNEAAYTDNPLCPDGKDGAQTKAKAYPAVRELQVLQGLGSQGIVGSVCAAQMTDKTHADFGYQPAIGALVDRLKQRLNDKCLPQQLTPDANGQVPCLVLEARNVGGGACDCDTPGRQPVSSDHVAAEAELPNKGAYDCFCEITPLKDDALLACENDTSTQPTADGKDVDGYCYVDATENIGAPSLVSGCPETEQREIRFVGKGHPVDNSSTLLLCSR